MVSRAEGDACVSYDDNRPIILHGPGWEQLPDGAWELPVECPTEVHYVTLPEHLPIGDKEVHKCGWNSAKKMACYRTGWTDLREALTATQMPLEALELHPRRPQTRSESPAQPTAGDLASSGPSLPLTGR